MSVDTDLTNLAATCRQIASKRDTSPEIADTARALLKEYEALIARPNSPTEQKNLETKKTDLKKRMKEFV